MLRFSRAFRQVALRLPDTHDELIGRISMRQPVRNWRLSMCRLALDFGEERGWTLTGSTFDDYQLSSLEYIRIFDHAFYYRKHRLPIAIVSHPYDLQSQKMKDRVISDMKDNGFDIEFPKQASWWYPEYTTMTVITRCSHD